MLKRRLYLLASRWCVVETTLVASTSACTMGPRAARTSRTARGPAAPDVFTCQTPVAVAGLVDDANLATAVAVASPTATGKKRKVTPRKAKTRAAQQSESTEHVSLAPEPAPEKARVGRKRKAEASAEHPSAKLSAAQSAEVASKMPATDEPTGAVKKVKKPRKKDVWPPGPLYSQEMRPPPHPGPQIRIISWNLAGMRAVLRKDPASLAKLAESQAVDVICLQETKLQGMHVEQMLEKLQMPGWSHHWSCSREKKGYSGTAVLCRQPPIAFREGLGHVDHDDEGRVITVELPELYVVNTYVPNSGGELKRLPYRIESWDVALAQHVQKLQAHKPVVLTGDLNCAPQPIDLSNPKTNKRSAGFTQEERDSFANRFLGDCELIDTFRAQHPGVVGYTHYPLRSKGRETGKGWRLDHFLVSKSLHPRVHDSYILKEVTGSDHVPLGLIVRKE